MRMLCDMMAGFTIRVPFVHCTDSLQDDETLLDPNPRPRELRAPTEDVPSADGQPVSTESTLDERLDTHIWP